MPRQDHYFFLLVHDRECDEPECAGFFQGFYAKALNLGEAIKDVLSTAKDTGLHCPWVVAADLSTQEAVAENTDFTPNQTVWPMGGRAYYGNDPNETSFSIPLGVVPSYDQNGIEGGEDPDDIQAGFIREVDGDSIILSANVDEADLWPHYETLLRLHDKYRVLWYNFEADWEDAGPLFLTNATLNTPAKIVHHLGSHRDDSLTNGFVGLTAYLAEGDTNVNISSHKKIEVHTTSKKIADFFAQELSALGYQQFEHLVSVDHMMLHRHYRLPGSRSREELITHLKAEGFQEWER